MGVCRRRQVREHFRPQGEGVPADRQRTASSSIPGSTCHRCCGPRSGSRSGPLSPIAISIPCLRVGLIRADGSNCHAAALHRRPALSPAVQPARVEQRQRLGARAGLGDARLLPMPTRPAGTGHYLNAARTAADWYVAHAPQSWVPRYDYNDPDRETLPYDSCAACIATAVLLRLARWLPDRAERYRDVARETSRRSFPTPDVGGVVLHGSWGRMRHIEAGQTPPRPLPARRRHAVRQLLDRRMSVPRAVGRTGQFSRSTAKPDTGEFTPCVVLTSASG